MKNKFKVALIGCGVISDNHILSLKRLDSIDIVALCDIDVNKAGKKKDQHNLNCKIYSDYIAMLDTEKLDAVHIMTPHYLHTDMTIESLKRNINVFLEKPMCIRTDDIEKIINTEKESSAKVCVSFQTRYNEAFKYASNVISRDGGVENAYATIMWNRNDEYYQSANCRGKWSTEGGGVMINQAIHTLDLLCIMLGIPKKVQAVCSTLRHSPDVEVEDICNCIIDFDSGKRANVYATTTFPGSDSTNLHLETKNHTLEIKGETLFIDDEKVVLPDNDKYMGKKCYGNSHATLIDAFYQALANNESMPVPLLEAQHAVKIILSAYKSNGKIIEI